MVWKYRFAKDVTNKLMIFGSNRKIGGFRRAAKKGHVWKELGVTTQVKMDVEVGTYLLSNDKNNVIAKNILRYFLCLSSKFEA